MRLIDADKCPCSDCGINGLYNGCTKECIMFKKWLDSTAYDVDKVADGVNEALDRLFNFCEEIDLHIPEDERTGYKMLNDIWAIRDIVKRGGVE